MGIFDEPVVDTRTSNDGGPTKYIPGYLIDHKDVTLYRFRSNLFIIKDIDRAINVSSLNHVLEKLTGVKNCGKVVGDFIVIKNTNKKPNSFRFILDKFLTEFGIVYDHMSGLPVEIYENLNKIDALQIEHIEVKDHQENIIEKGIEPLVNGINRFDGVDIIESCEGHYDKNDPAYDTNWQCCAYIVFTVDSMKNLNIISSSIEKNIKIMWDYFQLSDNEDWSTKAWFKKNGLMLTFDGGNSNTEFEFAYKYMSIDQEKVFEQIKYLGELLYAEK